LPEATPKDGSVAFGNTSLEKPKASAPPFAVAFGWAHGVSEKAKLFQASTPKPLASEVLPRSLRDFATLSGLDVLLRPKGPREVLPRSAFGAERQRQHCQGAGLWPR